MYYVKLWLNGEVARTLGTIRIGNIQVWLYTYWAFNLSRIEWNLGFVSIKLQDGN